MATTRINLNDWEPITQGDSYSESDRMLVIRPFKTVDGVQPPDVVLRMRSPSFFEVSDTANKQWFPQVRISKCCTQEKYNELVDWWFDCAKKDSLYIDDICSNSSTVTQETVPEYMATAKKWLKDCTYDQRKTYLHKYLKKRLPKK